MLTSAVASGPLYGPRQPESTVLYRVLQEHLETFIARTEASDRARAES